MQYVTTKSLRLEEENIIKDIKIVFRLKKDKITLQLNIKETRERISSN